MTEDVAYPTNSELSQNDGAAITDGEHEISDSDTRESDRRQDDARAPENDQQDLDDFRGVPVRLTPEPDNEEDADAICFEIDIDGHWRRIGYVARELTGYVHNAMRNNRSQSLSIKWIKYRFWPASGFGFYASFLISKRGQWDCQVVSKASY